MTLSRLPTQKAVPTLASVQPVLSKLVASPQRHAASTVDFGAETIHRMSDIGHDTLGVDLPTAELPEQPELPAANASPNDAPPTEPPPAEASPGADSAEVAFAETLFGDPESVDFSETMAADPISAATMAADVRTTARSQSMPQASAESGAVFELIERIGEGGMGVVWRARQGSLNREVAIKAIRPEVSSDEARARFIAEAVVTGGLDHPNVIPVHELGVGARGDVFLAMKLVGGFAWSDLLHPRTAEQRAAAEEFDLRRNLDVLGQVANAVAFAHSKGVVHRDLKPENVMVGAYGEVVLMDWGIAVDVRMPRPADVRGVHKLDIRGPAGTPAYMAPELARGDGKAVGPQTDVYLLGAILHELATGHAPHQGRNLGEVLLAAARSDPPDWPAGTPRALQKICHRAMARDPADRYPDAESFQNALRDYLEHEASLRLSQDAETLLTRLKTPHAVARSERYGLFSRAQARFTQALELWDGNDAARRGGAEVALLLAEEALDRGDTGLADAQREALAPLIESGDPRAAAVAAAIERTRSRGRGARWLTVVGLLLAVAGLAGIRELGQREAEAQAAQNARTARADTLREGWRAIADGQLARATTLIDRLEAAHAAAAEAHAAEATDDAPDGSDPAQDVDPQLEALRTARAVALWQRHEARDLFGVLCPRLPRPAGTRTLRYKIRSAPEVRGTALAAALDDRGARAGADRGGLCDVVADAVLAGAPAAAGLAAVALLEANAPLDAFDADLRRALRRGALCALAPDPLGCGASAAPFRLQLPGPELPEPVLTRTTSGAWQAIDPATGQARWHGPPPPKGQGSAIALPLSDGSLLLAEGAYLLRRDGRDGRLLARIPLPGPALQAWPVPPERTEIAVALWAGEDRGSVVRVRLDPEFPERPLWASDRALDWLGERPALVALVDEAFDDVARTLRISAPRARLDPRGWWGATVQIWHELERDHDDPEALLAALDGLGEAKNAPELAASLADQVLARTGGMLPLAQVEIAARLDRFGLPGHADRLIVRAAAAAITAGHNPDLERDAKRSAAGVLRGAARAAEKRGAPQRAIDLLLASHAFATALDGDAMLYARARATLGDALPAAARLRAAAVLADHGSLRTLEDLRRMDMALILLSLLSVLLLSALARLWWRSAGARRDDLRAAGFRDLRQAWLAFLRHPGDRLQLTFLAYSTRIERLSLGVFGVVVLLAVVGLVGELARHERIDLAAAPLLRGGLRHPDRIRLLEHAAPDEGAAGAARARLAAETFYAQGRMAEARVRLERALELQPEDAASRHNLGVLAMLRGERDAARATFAALTLPTARWNLALLEGRAPEKDAALRADLPERDRGGINLDPTLPLWARPASADLRAVLAGDPSSGVTMLIAAARGDTSQLASLFDGWPRPIGPAALLGLLFDSALAALLGLFALAALPMPVRRWSVPRLPRWQRRLGEVLRWVAPGWRLAGEGKAAIGVGLAVACSVGLAAAVAALGYGPMHVLHQARTDEVLFASAEVGVVVAASGPMRIAMVIGAVAMLLHLWQQARARRD
ncbi:MAG: protein kinase [Deltaproteobacteria bacterium]|nr:protein kinase [Deltaproteobacteria bacterium]